MKSSAPDAINWEKKKAVVFDLYGTLLDIETNENSGVLWKRMALIYNSYGTSYSGPSFRKRYIELCAEETAILQEKLGASGNSGEWPEIELRRVFLRLFLEGIQDHSLEDISAKAGSKNVESSVDHNHFDTGHGIIEERQKQMHDLMVSRTDLTGDFETDVQESKWLWQIGYTFRVFSRKRCRLYPNTIPVLIRLRELGKKIILLSNAQSCFTMAEIETTGLKPYLDDVYISSDAGIKKPDPDFMKMALENNGLCAEECVMVGNDFRSDAKIAFAHDMDCIFLNTFDFDEKEIVEKYHDVFPRDEFKPLIYEDGDIGHILDMLN